MKVTAAILLTLLVTAPRAARAQAAGEPDPANVRLRVGPLLVNPTISLTNIGVDNNVFNQADDQAPKRDFTLTVTPATDFWLRIGPSWLAGTIKEDIVWFQHYAAERAANTTYTRGWRVPLNRVAFSTGVSYANVRDRPGFEIDTRAQRTELGLNGGVELRAFAQTSLLVNGSRQRVAFDRNAEFLDSSLQPELNRLSTIYGGGVKHQLTSLTALAFNVSRTEDRFEFSSLRDSNSTTATFGATFDPVALIKGSATFGYRSFRPLSAGLEPFTGATAAVNLSYTLLDTARVAFQATRDVQYSYDVNQPYYVLAGLNFSVAQRLFGPVDVVARVGRQKLAYRDRADAAVEVADRVDYVRSYGGGVGYHLGKELRLGFNVDEYKRASDIAARRYDDLRIGSSLTYGF
jgi:hypothetical protein